ncbi:DUF2071 domain-containing protein [Nonomuraea sp. WAC 01424]|uniref:YqjF family protein n=1 Tax=Nonomuraea sp. WAC 01424 TaxID=2203200 RepID=UPI000F79AA25|nr:DUF2071 domain-containing protein [Nonomuraea sp. WAC 01424]RSN09415.1 DUF2071 domain-containing protein [Nonomuraea sp. WAC 01424]
MRAPVSPRVARPVMYQRWSRTTFMHWRYPPGTVQRLLPDGLTAETFDSTAWVGLVPFVMEDVGVPGLPRMPAFPETNLRTYVRDDRGRSGIWFLSLDAGTLPALLGGRAGFWLPYHWARMSVRSEGPLLRYRSRRRFGGVRCDADVTAGPPLTAAGRDELAHFLTARFRLFSVVAGRLAAAEVEHPPWPLHHARLDALEQDLTDAAGLPAPDGPPLLHGSPGVPVRVGMWRRGPRGAGRQG